MDGADLTRANVEGADLTSIKTIEDLTGLTFFRNVPMTEEQRDQLKLDVAGGFGQLESIISGCHASSTFAGSNF